MFYFTTFILNFCPILSTGDHDAKNRPGREQGTENQRVFPEKLQSGNDRHRKLIILKIKILRSLYNIEIV